MPLNLKISVDILHVICVDLVPIMAKVAICLLDPLCTYAVFHFNLQLTGSSGVKTLREASLAHKAVKFGDPRLTVLEKFEQ